MHPGDEELRETARRMQIRGADNMSREELEAAIETAEEEAPDADEPLQREVEKER